MTKRPGLDALPFATKPAPAPAQVAPTPAEPPPVMVMSSPVKDTRATIITRISREDRKTLKAIAVERDTSIQALVESAIQDIIRRSK